MCSGVSLNNNAVKEVILYFFVLIRRSTRAICQTLYYFGSVPGGETDRVNPSRCGSGGVLIPHHPRRLLHRSLRSPAGAVLGKTEISSV